jgi:hypothetical protein
MRDGDTLPTVEQLRAALDRMEDRGFVYTDEDTGEVLIRSRIRRDELDKQPTVFLAALRLLAVIDSPKFAAIMSVELDRMVNPEVKGDSDFAKKLRQNLNEASTAARAHLKALGGGYEIPSPIPNSRPSPEGYTGGYSRPAETGPSPIPNTEGSPIPSGSGSVSVSTSPTVGGQVGGAQAREPDSDPEPSEFCAKHQPHGDPSANCGPCGGYRKLHASWLKRQPDRATAQAEARRKVRENCTRCQGTSTYEDSDGHVRTCDHATESAHA